MVARARSPGFDSRQDLFFFFSSLLFFSFPWRHVFFLVIVVLFCFFIYLKFFQFIHFLPYCLISLLTSCRSPDSRPNWPIYPHTAPSTLSSTNVLITVSQWSRQLRLYAWLVGITRRQGDAILGRGELYSLHVLVRVKSIMRISALWMQLWHKRLRLAGEQRTAYK